MGHNEIAQNAASPETERAAGRPIWMSEYSARQFS